jgi:hypothetical protein
MLKNIRFLGLPSLKAGTQFIQPLKHVGFLAQCLSKNFNELLRLPHTYIKVERFMSIVEGTLILIPPLAMEAIDTSWIWVAVTCGIVILVLFIFWQVPKRKEKKAGITEAKPPPPAETVATGQMPFQMERSISDEEASRARVELKILGLEKEIVSYALTRLYEAEAEGKITEAERDRLVSRYKDEMNRLEERIGHGESVITLHELEKTQSELIKMFREKFDEINQKIGEVRAKLGVLPEEVKPAVTPVVEEKPKPKKPPEAVEPTAPKPTPPRTKAEEKIEEIRAEVLKELEKLEQMETEG